MVRGRKHLLACAISVFLVLSLLLPGCGQSPGAATRSPEERTSGEDSPVLPVTSPDERSSGEGDPSPPYSLELSFPNGAPALNQVAELKVVAIHKTSVMNDVRIDVILPEGFELISGNLTWVGDSLPYGDKEVINAQIKAKRTGNWTIEALIAHSAGGSEYAIYVAVSENTAEWGIYPPWLKNEGYTTPVKRTKEVSSPISVKLEIQDAPALGEMAELNWTLLSIVDVPDIEGRIILPDGVSLLNGTATWNGELKRKQPVSLAARIVFNTAGNWAIEGVVRHSLTPNSGWSDSDILYLDIGTEHSSFGWATTGKISVTQTKKGEKEPVGPFSGSEPRVSELPVPPSVSLDGIVSDKQEHHSITVTGTYKYWTELSDYRDDPDETVGANTFLVEIADGNGNFLAYDYTDTQGNFSVSGVDPSGNITARLWAYVHYDLPDDPELRVVHSGNSLTGLTDVWSTNFTDVFEFDDDGQEHSIGEWTMDQGGTGDGAWWIKDDLSRSFIYLHNQGAVDLGSATVRWNDSSTDGNHYDYDVTDQIHLKGEAERRPDAVIHEYGHNLMDNIYGFLPDMDYGPDNKHYFFWDEDASTAWVEGWPDFLPLVINGNPEYTYEGGQPENLEEPTWDYDPGEPPSEEYTTSKGDAVEGRVAGALWDIFDSINDNYYYPYYWDQCNEGFGEIWDTFSTNTSDTFAEFWDSLKGEFPNYKPARNAIYQNTIAYDIIPGDANEDNNVNALDITKVERMIAGLQNSRS